MNNRSAEIVSLALQRVPPAIIAQRLGVHKSTVYDVIRQARRAGTNIPAFSTVSKAVAGEPLAQKPEALGAAQPTRQIVVSMRLYSLLEREADRRGLTPTEAARRLLEKALLGTVTS